MTSEIQITLTGDGIPNIVPIGASVSYGINRLPVASVQLNPQSLSLLCDFDTVRRKNVTLNIKTNRGCIVFEGVIDGNSISQQPGSLTTSLIIRHKYTFLNEIYPRMIGLSAGSANAFAITNVITYNPGEVEKGVERIEAGNGEGGQEGLYLEDSQLFGFEQYGLSTNQNLMDFLVAFNKVLIKAQMNSRLLQTKVTYADEPNNLYSILDAADINAHLMGPVALNLLSSIVTKYTSKFALTAATPSLAGPIIKDVGFLEDTLFSNLIKMINEYNCVFVIGNNHAYIVPEAAYLAVPKTASLRRTQKSAQYNIALPADYESFTFSDNGENTVKGVYVIPDPVQTTQWGMSTSHVISGVYLDPNPNVFGNIVVKSIPAVAGIAMGYAAAVGSQGIQSNIKSQTPLINAPVQTADVQASMDTAAATLNSNWVIPYRNYINQWAEIEYCKIKYDDRVGSISMPFNNNWIPGGVGSIYTRQPGTYIDFYVTEVTHTFSVSVPASGSANTSVSFKGGRPGASDPGLDTISLFDYSYTDNISFCNDFIKDISTL